jgi:hypothetical protein
MPFPFGFPGEFPNLDPAVAATLDVVDHAAAGFRRIAQYLRGKSNAASVFSALFTQAQDVEGALQELIYYRRVDNAFGQHLDNIGGVIGQPRGGLGDDDYKLYLKAKIKANLSSGTPEDLYSVLGLIVPDSVMEYTPMYPAAFEFSITGAITEATARALLSFLRTARAAGVRGILRWGISPTGDLFRMDSGPGLDQGKFTGAAV